MMGTGMVIDPDDVEYCEKHEIQFIAGDVCCMCDKENLLMERIVILESFLRATINDAGATDGLKSCARDFLKGNPNG